MAMKTYKANTNVSINVVLANKKNLHISFVPLSNGSSVFTTDNAEVQEAIERHYNFGKLFRGSEALSGDGMGRKGEGLRAGALSTGEEKGTGEMGETGPTGLTGGSGLRRVQVSDIAAARDFLADTYGVSRTAMKSTKAIQEKAQECGVEFEIRG